MVTPRDIEKAVHNVRDQEGFIRELLVGALEWEIPDGMERIDDISLPWSEDELRARGLERRLLDGQAWQIQSLRQGQPWGIFLLQFARPDHFTARGGLHGATGTLRQVLRGLVPSRRHDSALPSWQRENLLFICTHDYRQFRFAYFKAPRDSQKTAPLASFGWNQGDTHLRTLCEFNLPALTFPDDRGADADAWVSRWASAFDVEAVTKRFFVEYRAVFEKVEAGVKGVPNREVRRLYTQRLFNRLMFLYFIQRKGWLSFRGDTNYLRALFNTALVNKEDFLNDRLYWTFFYGLNTAGEDYAVHSDAKLKERRGEVPFLNGGLFDLEDDYDVREKVRIPNNAFAAVIDLFERYNFTVTESTPLDVEVAVDPEMLGKVFEELVTGRHETGSYYTPRPIVSFMCREALKHYLAQVVSDESAVARFVDEGDPTKLPDPEAVLNALRAVKVCDPACGSGAYLLGMMQELLRTARDAFRRPWPGRRDRLQPQTGDHSKQPLRRGHRPVCRQHRQAATVAQSRHRLPGTEAAALAQPGFQDRMRRQSDRARSSRDSRSFPQATRRLRGSPRQSQGAIPVNAVGGCAARHPKGTGEQGLLRSLAVA